jgi:hypothetical protein
MLDYGRESAMLAASASGMAIVLVLFFCLGAFLVFAGEGERYNHMKQRRYMLKIANEDLAKDGSVTNISGTTVA